MHSVGFPCVSQVLTQRHCGSILQVDFSTHLDVDPKRRYATHCTLYSIFPCILIFILQVYFSTRLDVDPKRRCATHYTLYSIVACSLIDFPTHRIVEFENKPTMLFLFYFGVWEDAVATAKEGL